MDDDVYKAPFTVEEMCKKLPMLAHETSRFVWFRDGNDQLWPVMESYNDELNDGTPCLMLDAKPLDASRIAEKMQLENGSSEWVK